MTSLPRSLRIQVATRQTMDLFTLENITISQDWLTPIGVALVLLSFYWFRAALRRYEGRKRDASADVEAIRAEAKRRL